MNKASRVALFNEATELPGQGVEMQSNAQRSVCTYYRSWLAAWGHSNVRISINKRKMPNIRSGLIDSTTEKSYWVEGSASDPWADLHFASVMDASVASQLSTFALILT